MESAEKWQISVLALFLKTNIVESAGPQVEERSAAKLQKGGQEGDVSH